MNLRAKDKIKGTAPISRGRSAEVYDWGNGRVLKLFYENCPPDRASTEALITDSVFRAGLPVPEVFDTIERDNRQGIVFEKIDGISMLDACIATPQQAGEYGSLLASIHRKIHKKTIETLPDLLPRLVRSARKSAQLSAEQKNKMVNYLESRTEECRLCHMDLHPGQVLISGKGPRVIDWETASHGNPRMDVARTALILSIGEIPNPNSVSMHDLNAIRGKLISAYLSQYFSHQDKTSKQSSIIWDLAAAIIRYDEKIDGERQQIENVIEMKTAIFDELDFQLPA